MSMGFIYKPGVPLETLSKGSNKVVTTGMSESKQYAPIY